MMIKNEQLEKDINQSKIDSLYLFYGKETFVLETCLKKIKSKIGELVEGINYIKIDNTNVNDLISNIETPAFGYEKKLIIAKNTELFKKQGKNKSSLNTELIDKINNYIKENIEIIKESVILIFIEQEAEKNDLYQSIEDLGIVCNFEELKPVEAMARIKTICNAYKVKIDDNTTKYFIECCGTNMQELINEIRKPIEYVGENEVITKEIINLLSIRKIDSIIFDLTDNLGNRNIKKAIQVLDDLLYQKEPIQKILITLYNHFKKLYLVKIAIKENKNIAEILKLKSNQTFLAGKYRTQSSYFKEEELNQILKALINLDDDYKAGLIDLNIGLESILCKYCS